MDLRRGHIRYGREHTERHQRHCGAVQTPFTGPLHLDVRFPRPWRMVDGCPIRARLARHLTERSRAMSDISNKAQEVTGKVKEKVGELTGDEELEAEGQDDQAESKVKQFADDAKDAVEDVVDKVKGIFKK